MPSVEKTWTDKPFPQFSLNDQDGNSWDNSSFDGKWTVLFFYPKDESPGCSIQAQTFQEKLPDFTAYNAQIVGVSADDGESHRQFICKYSLEFPLLHDSKSALHKQMKLGRTAGVIPKRVTFLIDEQGVIRYVFNSQMGVKKHVFNCLKFLGLAQN